MLKYKEEQYYNGLQYYNEILQWNSYLSQIMTNNFKGVNHKAYEKMRKLNKFGILFSLKKLFR